MAVTKTTLSYKKAIIDKERGLIVEQIPVKGGEIETKVYSINSIIDRLSKAEDINITFVFDEEIEPEDTQY